MLKQYCKLFLVAFTALVSTPACFAAVEVSTDLRVVIIRHGEKPKRGENLTCQGENRSHQLPAVLQSKFGKLDYIYVPTVVSQGNKTLHSRMFQTATPLAVHNTVDINSQFSRTDTVNVAKSVMEKKGTVLLVWNHTAIVKLAQSLGADPTAWPDSDYDSIWVITYPQGKAVLTEDAQKLSPSSQCGFHAVGTQT